jgi:carbamoyl-phosphate synthase large subunit
MARGDSRRKSTETIPVLFSCVGRRVQLLTAFRQAAARLGVRLVIHGADASPLSPAVHLVDGAHRVPKIDDTAYIDALLEIVHRERVRLLVPLLDLELLPLAETAGRFEEAGCTTLISTSEVVRICRDKMSTHRTLVEAGIDTPATWTWEEALARTAHAFPYYMKPRAGSAAAGNYIIHNMEELRTLGRRVPGAIVQEFVDGAEYTMDVYCGLDGRPRCAVPRRRLEVRNGEVSKALIVKDRSLMAVGMRVAEALGGCRGMITVQCIMTAGRRIRVIEINPRFGGGVPLAIHAGADFPLWILMEVLGRRPRISATGFRDDIVMLRFDDAVFVPRGSRFLAAGNAGFPRGAVRQAEDAGPASSPVSRRTLKRG